MSSKHWIVAAGIVAGMTGAALAEEHHPRLLVTPVRLAVIRQQAAIKDSHHQLALTQLQAAVDKAEPGDEDEGNYGPGYQAVQLTTLCAVAEDPADVTAKDPTGVFPPAATIKDNAVTVAGKTIRFDTGAGRLVCK